MFNLFKKNLVEYNARHNWLRLTDDFSIDIDSVRFDFAEQTLDVLLSSPADMGLDLSLWRIFFAHDKQCQAVILEEAVLSLVDGKYYNRNHEPQYAEIAQDSPVGMIYNKYQPKFGADLPYDFSGKWLAVTTDNSVFMLDVESIAWEAKVFHCALRFLREEEGLDDQALFAYDTNGDVVRIIEEGVFVDSNRTFTLYQDEFAKANEVMQPFCDTIKENIAELQNPLWCKENAKKWEEFFQN